MSAQPSATVTSRCTECSFTIQPGASRVLTEYGWAHPLCLMAGSDWSPRSW